ncbi:MAG: hypothetical protein LBL97_09135 [Prevotellaceae bacterium]|jgi:predicted tellurium resistance membrane protein TerC|nr:hypothetical protein [Prevotellaceae bacterium]
MLEEEIISGLWIAFMIGMYFMLIGIPVLRTLKAESLNKGEYISVGGGVLLFLVSGFMIIANGYELEYLRLRPGNYCTGVLGIFAGSYAWFFLFQAWNKKLSRR